MKRSLACFIVASLLASLDSLAHAATPACLSLPTDAAQVATLRQQIDADCACASFDGSKGKRKGDYAKCVGALLSLAVDANNLRTPCAKRLKTAYKKSTCGRDPLRNWVPCLKTSANGKFKCTIVAMTKSDGVTPHDGCAARNGASATTCTQHENCLDTADRNSDLLIDSLDAGACLPPPPPSDDDIRYCCFHHASSSTCTYDFGSDACGCNAVSYSCHRPAIGQADPPNYPPAMLPADGSLEPVPQSAGQICDYSYCYSFVDGFWVSQLRSTGTGTDVPNPPTLATPPDLESPFIDYNYCDLHHCYWLSNPILGYWSAILRYDSELTTPGNFTPSFFCGLHHCYTRSGSGVWSSRAIDVSLPSPPPVPWTPATGAPSAITIPLGTPLPPQGYCCEGTYCYALNHYDVWMVAGERSTFPLIEPCFPPTAQDDFEACCIDHIYGGDSNCSAYSGTSCTCEDDEGAVREISCATPEILSSVPPSVPPPNVPPPGAVVPPPPSAQADHCDYSYCYFYDPIDGWYAAPRSVDSFNSPTNLPAVSVGPSASPSPFFPHHYCDRFYCYGKTEGGFWYPMLRYGSELTQSTSITSTFFCGLHHCFTFSGGAWTASPIDPIAIGVPAPALPPQFFLAALNVAPDIEVPEGMCLDAHYKYFPNHYGIWVATVKTASDVGPLCSVAIPGWPHHNIRSCCSTQTSNASCAYVSAGNSCNCDSEIYSCDRPPLPATPPGASAPIMHADDTPLPPPQLASALYCDYYYCYSYSAGSWSAALRASGGSPPPPNLPAPTFLPPYPQTPYVSNLNYCDRFYCYGMANEILGYWRAVLRYGSEVTSVSSITATSYCGLHHCYNRGGDGVWSFTVIDATVEVPLPPPRMPPTNWPSAKSVPPSTAPSVGWCCQDSYCYEPNHYGLWVAEYQSDPGPAPLCSEVIPDWP